MSKALLHRDHLNRNAAEPAVRYSVYEWSAFGAVRLVDTITATSDCDALKQARKLLPQRPGELRNGARTVCRFGTSGGFMLHS